MAHNIVLVFHRKPPTKYSWSAEIRSANEYSGKPPQGFSVKLSAKAKSGFKGQTIKASIPMVREDIPVAILLRALDIIPDKAIQDLMIYDHSDSDMIDMLRASLEEAQTIRTREDALDYIAKKGSNYGYNREARMRFAMSMLEDKLLPHISTDSDGSLKKAYFVGYMVNRLLTGALGRSTEDDRDYYGKKRLEMAGTLLAGLYRTLFR